MTASGQRRAVGDETQSFFGSRWVEVPGNVTEIAGGLPRGFRAAGVACGIKPSGGSDLGLLVSSAPATTSAARFTNSGTQSAPVLLCRERVRSDGIRAVVVNSGNANAATGRPGFENAAKMQGAAALASRCPEGAVAVASTGVIGVPLPIELGDDRNRAGDARARTRGRGRLRARDPHHRHPRQARRASTWRSAAAPSV